MLMFRLVSIGDETEPAATRDSVSLELMLTKLNRVLMLMFESDASLTFLDSDEFLENLLVFVNSAVLAGIDVKDVAELLLFKDPLGTLQSNRLDKEAPIEALLDFVAGTVTFDDLLLQVLCWN